MSVLLWHKEKISVHPRVHKDKQLSCFTLQTSPYHGEWFDWAWFVDLARSWSFVPTTKLSAPWEDLVPFCIPTTDKEQPLCSLFLRESHFLTLGDTIRVPAKTERGKSLLFLQQSSPAQGIPAGERHRRHVTGWSALGSKTVGEECEQI